MAFSSVSRDFLDEEERNQIWKVLDEDKGILKHSYTVSQLRKKFKKRFQTFNEFLGDLNLCSCPKR